MGGTPIALAQAVRVYQAAENRCHTEAQKTWKECYEGVSGVRHAVRQTGVWILIPPLCLLCPLGQVTSLLFVLSVQWELHVPTSLGCHRIKLDDVLKGVGRLLPSTCTKINSKWIEDLNMRAKTTTLFKENIEQKLHDTGFENYFLKVTPKAQKTKAKIDIELHKN